jgi:hypothetical protein
MAELHQEAGLSIVDLEGHNALRHNKQMVNKTPDPDVFTSPGRPLPTKKVRGWLWQHRQDFNPVFEHTVLWSFYDEVSGQTLAGYGEFTDGHQS